MCQKIREGVVTIFKKEEKVELGNYRLIPLRSVPGKILEKSNKGTK